MKENKYDQEQFFEKYAQMNRSKVGLIAAGEWETLKQILPELSGKTLLDLGCGYGWHCIYAMQQGAIKASNGFEIREVVELQPSEQMIDTIQKICIRMIMEVRLILTKRIPP